MLPQSAPAARWTRQRQVILDVLTHGEGHLNADEIYVRARTRDPRLSLSTVYRTLNILRRAGVIGSCIWRTATTTTSLVQPPSAGMTTGTWCVADAAR